MYDTSLTLLWDRYKINWSQMFGISTRDLPAMSFADRPIACLCKSCGQFHSPTDSHLYDYHQPVDDDLTCSICLQPLVDPVDTKCGHTYCEKCINNFLTLQNVCPNDRNLLKAIDLQPAPLIIRRLLDKLEVVCPNVHYCEEVLPRCELEDHLKYRCKGAVVRCHRHEQGCKFQGPRSAIESHLWECEYEDNKDYSLTACIKEGQISKISIPRGSCDLGISVIGGVDTALIAVTVQEVFPDGLIDRDDRIRPGDQLLEVNGIDLTRATHFKAKQALNEIVPLVRLTVFRDCRDRPFEKEDIIKIIVNKDPGRQLGIKLIRKRHNAGVYIKELIPGSVAHSDGQLQVNDRILEVNSDDLSITPEENSSNHIQAAHGALQFVVSRKCRSDTLHTRRFSKRNSSAVSLSSLTIPYSRMPSICSQLSNLSQISSHSFDLLEEKFRSAQNPARCSAKTITITKTRHESLGLSVSGGLHSKRGDTPLYVMHITPNGPAARAGIKKGDILLSVNGAKLLNLTHNDAVKVLKSKSSHRKVELKLLVTSETADGSDSFLPTWMYWLDLPDDCWLDKEIKINVEQKDLGFIITGGRDFPLGPQPIFVKAVRDDSLAYMHNIRTGDIITNINGASTKDLGLSDIYGLLDDCIQSPDGKLTLKTIRWPGTIV